MKLVEVKTISKGPGGPVPDELSVDGETFSVRGITDRWFDARANYFKVVASNGIAYLLRQDLQQPIWTVVHAWRLDA
jgi:hypothetical protein